MFKKITFLVKFQVINKAIKLTTKISEISNKIRDKLLNYSFKMYKDFVAWSLEAGVFNKDDIDKFEEEASEPP